jgi:hypothetical protein
MESAHHVFPASLNPPAPNRCPRNSTHPSQICSFTPQISPGCTKLQCGDWKSPLRGGGPENSDGSPSATRSRHFQWQAGRGARSHAVLRRGLRTTPVSGGHSLPQKPAPTRDSPLFRGWPTRLPRQPVTVNLSPLKMRSKRQIGPLSLRKPLATQQVPMITVGCSSIAHYKSPGNPCG